MQAQRAKAGSLVILDAKTGEVLALVNLPDYNPNNRAAVTGRSLRNRAVTDLFEPGSTMKPFTVAAALDAGIVTPDTPIQTAPGTMTIGGWTISDSSPHGVLSVAQVIQKSSNVGAAKIQLAMQPERMGTFYRELGFGLAPRTGFPGEAKGSVRPWAEWSHGRPLSTNGLAKLLHINSQRTPARSRPIARGSRAALNTTRSTGAGAARRTDCAPISVCARVSASTEARGSRPSCTGSFARVDTHGCPPTGGGDMGGPGRTIHSRGQVLQSDISRPGLSVSAPDARRMAMSKCTERNSRPAWPVHPLAGRSDREETPRLTPE